MPQHIMIPMFGKRLRVTETTRGGTVTPGTHRAITTDGFITLNLSSETEDGAEVLVRNAAGNLCVNEKKSNSFKRFNLEIEFCGVNPELLAMVTNAEVYADYAADIAGFTVPEGEIDKQFALELWTGLSGISEAGDDASGYLLLPLVDAGILGDFTVDGENAITFSMTGAATRGGNHWGVGPYDVVMDTTVPETPTPAPLPTALDPFDHLLLIDTAVAPPPVAVDAAVVPA